MTRACSSSSSRLLPVLGIIGALALIGAGCSGGETGDSGGSSSTSDTGAANEIVDDFPEVPALPPGARELVLAEQIIPAGTEKQFCYFLDPELEDLYTTALTSYQGKFGHHLVLFRTVAPETPGTIRDCTSIADMVSLLPVISSVNFGLEEFPPGLALKVTKGSQLVLQQHYVNTSEHDIRVRDVAHLTLTDAAKVETLVGFYGISDVSYDMPPSADEQTVDFTCDVPRDMKLLLMGPHMHEWGVRFSAAAGPADAMTEIIHVDPWKAEYRDYPPVQEWGVDGALALKAGDKIRTTCVFKNTTDGDLTFPKEMCATYGYYFPAPEEGADWTCDGSSSP